MMDIPPLSQLVDIPALKRMADAQYQATGIPVGIISAIDNSIVVGTGWQDICIHFHRNNEDSRLCCEISDNYIKKNLRKGEATSYKCLNGLWDIGVPIMVAGQHLATLFFGQFFYKDEVPDRTFFKAQAEKYQFDVDEYLTALDRVRIFSREQVDMIIAYNTGFAGFISALAERSFYKTTTEKKLQEKQLELQQTQKMEAIGTLAGGVAHDFNNILSGIIGYTELALLQLDGQEKVKNNLENVLSAAARAKDLTRQILAFSRRDDGCEDLRPVAVHGIVFEACRLLRKTIPSSIDLYLDVDSSTGEILADATQILQVVMNLCTNAFHAIPESGGQIAVTLNDVEIDSSSAAEMVPQRAGRYALLLVCDTGKGMSEDVLKRIFEPFFTTKGPGDGTGMGLAVVHGIIKQHGGEIFVQSTPGWGTLFKVYLPLVEESAESPSSVLFADEDLKGSERILFVDDEATLAQMGKSTLETFGYQVTAMTSSFEAFSLFKDNPDGYDLIITDQTMPGMTGDLLIRKMLDIRQDLPIIICTGYSTILNADRAEALGAKAFLMKPVEWRTLIHKVRTALSS